MKWYNKKFSFIVFYCLFLVVRLFPVSLLLNDGRLYSGDLLYISNEKVIIQKEVFFFEIKSSDIDILINPPSSDYKGKKIFVSLNTFNDNSITGELIKSTANLIYILSRPGGRVLLYNYRDISFLGLIEGSSEEDILQGNEEYFRKVVIKPKEYSIDERFDNLLITLKLLSGLANENQTVTFDRLELFDPDFYDIFWNNIHIYLGVNTKEIIWNLIENYYEKEVILFHIYGDREEGLLYNQKFLKQTRDEFFQRAKKIILTITE